MKTNLLLASDNIVAVDATAARFLGFEPSDLDHLREASARGLGPIDRDEIRLLGSNLDEFKFTSRRAERDYEEFRKLLSFVDPAVCKNCRQAFASGLVAAVEEVGEERINGIRVVLGPIGKPPHFRGNGCYSMDLVRADSKSMVFSFLGVRLLLARRKKPF